MTAVTGTPATPAVAWKDGKRYLWPLALLIPTFPFIAWGLVAATGAGLIWWTGPLLVFGFFPMLDHLIGEDDSNPPESAVPALEADPYYRRLTYLFLLLQYGGLILACWMWAYGDLSVPDKIGLALTVGTVSGIAIATAHELGHKKESVERWLCKISLAQTGYGHFYIEHNRGHHVRVATPEDPATARMGESFYRFLPRTVFGGMRSGWRLEKARLAKLGKGPWTLRNDVLNAWLMTPLLAAVLLAIFGLRIWPYLLIQAFGFILLEVVNYLEHYGLLRQKTESGRYERCRPEHSWNSNSVASNLFLFHLQRHSDHHANPTRRYQALRHYDEAPQLPAGYATMVLLAVTPPLWRRVMDKRLLAHYGGDITRANIHPPKRAKILAKYGASAEASAK